VVLATIRLIFWMQTHFTSTQLNSDSTNKTTVHFFTLHFMLNSLQRSHGREDDAHSNVVLPFGTTQNFSLSNKHSGNCGASENGSTIKLAKKASFHS
jgi:hypothetical protein